MSAACYKASSQQEVPLTWDTGAVRTASLLCQQKYPVALIGGPVSNCCFSGFAALRLQQGREGSFRYHDLSRPFPLAAFVLTVTARTGAHHTTTRCIWAPRRPPASTAARGRGTRCTGKEGPRMAKAGCIPERPPSSQWAGTGMSLALMEQALWRDFSVPLPHLPCARYPLLRPRASRTSKFPWCAAGRDAWVPFPFLLHKVTQA